MAKEAAKAIKQQLVNGEEVLWASQAPVMRTALGHVFPVALASIVTASMLAALAVGVATGGFGPFVLPDGQLDFSKIIAVSLLSVVCLVGSTWLAWVALKDMLNAGNTFYVLTNRRVMIMSGLVAPHVMSVWPSLIGDVKTIGSQTNGDVVLVSSLPWSIMKKSFAQPRDISLFNVDNPQQVADLIKSTLVGKSSSANSE